MCVCTRVSVCHSADAEVRGQPAGSHLPHWESPQAWQQKSLPTEPSSWTTLKILKIGTLVSLSFSPRLLSRLLKPNSSKTQKQNCPISLWVWVKTGKETTGLQEKLWRRKGLALGGPRRAQVLCWARVSDNTAHGVAGGWAREWVLKWVGRVVQ